MSLGYIVWDPWICANPSSRCQAVSPSKWKLKPWISVANFTAIQLVVVRTAPFKSQLLTSWRRRRKVRASPKSVYVVDGRRNMKLDNINHFQPVRASRETTWRGMGVWRAEKTLRGKGDWLCNGGTCLRVPSEFMLAEGRHPASVAPLGLCHIALMSWFIVTGNWPTLRPALVSCVELYSKKQQPQQLQFMLHWLVTFNWQQWSVSTCCWLALQTLHL